MLFEVGRIQFLDGLEVKKTSCRDVWGMKDRSERRLVLKKWQIRSLPFLIMYCGGISRALPRKGRYYVNAMKYLT